MPTFQLVLLMLIPYRMARKLVAERYGPDAKVKKDMLVSTLSQTWRSDSNRGSRDLSSRTA